MTIDTHLAAGGDTVTLCEKPPAPGLKTTTNIVEVTCAACLAEVTKFREGADAGNQLKPYEHRVTAGPELRAHIRNLSGRAVRITGGEPPQTPPLRQVVEQLADMGAEYVEDDDGDFIEVDTGHLRAVHVCQEEGGDRFEVVAVTWDIWNAADENLLGCGIVLNMVAPFVRAAVADHDAADHALEAAMTPDAEKPGSDGTSLAIPSLATGFKPHKHHREIAERILAASAEKPGSEERLQQLWGMVVEVGMANGHGRDLLVDAYCTVTGEDPETVRERLQEALQARHEAYLDSAEAYATDGEALMSGADG